MGALANAHTTAHRPCHRARPLQGLMWLHKLAEAEEVLETSVAWLFNLPTRELPGLYEVGRAFNGV